MIQDHLAIFMANGKEIYRIKSKPINKFFWLQEQARAIDHLIKNRFFRAEEISVNDLGPQSDKMSVARPIHPSKAHRIKVAQ